MKQIPAISKGDTSLRVYIHHIYGTLLLNPQAAAAAPAAAAVAADVAVAALGLYL